MASGGPSSAVALQLTDILKDGKTALDVKHAEVFKLTSMFLEVSKILQTRHRELLSSLQNSYETKAAANEDPDPAQWLLRMKKIERIGKRISRKGAKFNVELQNKRTEFTMLYTKLQTAYAVALNVATLATGTPVTLDEILKHQQHLASIKSKINRINTLTYKFNLALGLFGVILESLAANSILMVPGSSVPPIDLRAEQALLEEAAPGGEDTQFYATIQADYLRRLPPTPMDLEKVTLDQFGADYIDRVKDMVNFEDPDHGMYYEFNVTAGLPIDSTNIDGEWLTAGNVDAQSMFVDPRYLADARVTNYKVAEWKREYDDKSMRHTLDPSAPRPPPNFDIYYQEQRALYAAAAGKAKGARPKRTTPYNRSRP